MPESGLAEMLKHGLIKNRDHWDNLVQLPDHSSETLAPFIMDSIHLKEEVVNNDPFEKGERKILNFGHTIGHAIESESLETDFPLLHGEAIVIGMIIEAFLSYDQELISKADLEEVCEGFSSMYALNTIDMKIFPNLTKWMKHDKKNQNNSINFSLINKIGSCRYDVICTIDEIRRAFEKYNQWIA